MIQEMVKSKVAGVIFTADPVSGNIAIANEHQMINSIIVGEAGRVTITSNWGLGESVVSGQVDPDTLVVSADTCQVVERRVGSKLVRHVTRQDGEVEEVSSDDSDSDSMVCSVSDSLAEQLTRLAMRLDREMNCALDIEFAVTEEGDIQILQARPITTFFTWTDWELGHELDTGVASDHELLTRGNVGEVFNGALTPLTQSTVVKTLDLAICEQAVPKTSSDTYISHSMTWLATSQHQVFLRFLDVMLRFPEPSLSIANKGIDFAVFGHEVTTQDMLGEWREHLNLIKIYRHKIFPDEALLRHKPRDSFKHNTVLAHDLLFGGRFHEKIVKKFVNLELFSPDEKEENCKSFFVDISQKLHYLLKISECLG